MAAGSSRTWLRGEGELLRTGGESNVGHRQPSSFAVLRIALSVSVLTLLSHHASAQTPVESSAEARFQLDVHVPDAALAPLVPMGFTLNVATQGADKDAKLR